MPACVCVCVYVEKHEILPPPQAIHSHIFSPWDDGVCVDIPSQVECRERTKMENIKNKNRNHKAVVRRVYPRQTLPKAYKDVIKYL